MSYSIKCVWIYLDYGANYWLLLNVWFVYCDCDEDDVCTFVDLHWLGQDWIRGYVICQ